MDILRFFSMDWDRFIRDEFTEIISQIPRAEYRPSDIFVDSEGSVTITTPLEFCKTPAGRFFLWLTGAYIVQILLVF